MKPWVTSSLRAFKVIMWMKGTVTLVDAHSLTDQLHCAGVFLFRTNWFQHLRLRSWDRVTCSSKLEQVDCGLSQNKSSPVTFEARSGDVVLTFTPSHHIILESKKRHVMCHVRLCLHSYVIAMCCSDNEPHRTCGLKHGWKTWMINLFSFWLIHSCTEARSIFSLFPFLFLLIYALFVH